MKALPRRMASSRLAARRRLERAQARAHHSRCRALAGVHPHARTGRHRERPALYIEIEPVIVGTAIVSAISIKPALRMGSGNTPRAWGSIFGAAPHPS